MHDANTILLNTTTIDSNSDGNGSGSDPTIAPGAVVDIQEEQEIAIFVAIGPSDTNGEPGDADTMAIIPQVSIDGGSNWTNGPAFRSILGSEAPDREAAGQSTLRLAVRWRLPRSEVAGVNTVKVRLNTTASDTSNWGVYADVRAPQDVRSEYYADAAGE